MSIALTFTTESQIPESLNHIFSTVRIQGRMISLYEADRHSEWQRVLKVLQQEGVTVSPTSITFADSTTPDWKRPSAHWCAAVLDSDQVQRAANGEDDFPLPLPHPCQEHLNEECPILLSEPPFGQVVSVGETRIFSQPIADLLSGSGNVSIGDQDILLDGKCVPGWRSLRFHDSCQVIAVESILPETNCRMCGTPYRSTTGIWLSEAQPSMDSGCALDQRGFGHSATRRPLVLSSEIASGIHQLARGKGLTLDPVYHRDSPVGKWMIDIIADIHKLALRDA